MPAPHPPPRSLAEDQRGAIMLIGLFMACSLVGALWFIVGIGDAIVFREKMQEAADVGAFSSAALQAKGMNFIALLNLIMVAMTVVHIVLGVMADVKLAQATKICIETSILILPCLAALADYTAAYNRWDQYFRLMSRTFRQAHKAQQLASYVFPAMGVVEAYQNGATYGGDKRTSAVRVLALGSSVIPKGGKEGLPIEPKKFEDLCRKVITVSATGGLNLLGIGKEIGGLENGGKALEEFNKVFDLIGGALQIAYCNKTNLHFPPFGPGWDSFWGEDGPYVVQSAAQNGNDWMQTWAINIAPRLHDTSESHVGIAGGPKGASKYTTDEGPPGYFAQAEMYVDCDQTWSDTVCNFEDQAMYTIKWRARLRRCDTLAMANRGASAAIDRVLNLPKVASFREGLGGKVADLLGADGVVTRGGIESIVNDVLTKGEEYGRGKVEEGVTDGINNAGLNSYH